MSKCYTCDGTGVCGDCDGTGEREVFLPDDWRFDTLSELQSVLRDLSEMGDDMEIVIRPNDSVHIQYTRLDGVVCRAIGIADPRHPLSQLANAIDELREQVSRQRAKA